MPSPPLILAADIGSTTCKAVLIDRAGVIVASATAAYPDGRTPDDPRAWWFTFTNVIARLRAGVPFWHPLAVVLCGRGTGPALLDEAGLPLEIPWDAVRGRVRACGPYQSAQSERVASWANLIAAVRHVVPDLGIKIRAILPVKDYINFCLTGNQTTDAGSAGCLAWPPASEFGLDEIRLPGISGSETRLGDVARPDLAVEPGTPVFVGSHDGVCANIGAGMVMQDQGCVTLGTTGVIRINTVGPVFPDESLNTFTYPFPGGLWTSGADALGTGAAVVWAARMLGLFDGRPEQFSSALETLDGLAASAPAGSEGALFLPYLEGMVSPRSRLDARGAFIGLTSRHMAPHVARAVMEGSGLALRMLSDALANRRVQAHTLTLTGGGSKSKVWPQIVADVLERPLLIAAPEASARGAAMLGAIGLGWYDDLHQTARGMTSHVGVITPEERYRAVYRSAYTRFAGLVNDWGA